MSEVCPPKEEATASSSSSLDSLGREEARQTKDLRQSLESSMLA